MGRGAGGCLVAVETRGQHSQRGRGNQKIGWLVVLFCSGSVKRRLMNCVGVAVAPLQGPIAVRGDSATATPTQPRRMADKARARISTPGCIPTRGVARKVGRIVRAPSPPHLVLFLISIQLNWGKVVTIIRSFPTIASICTHTCSFILPRLLGLLTVVTPNLKSGNKTMDGFIAVLSGLRAVGHRGESRGNRGGTSCPPIVCIGRAISGWSRSKTGRC